MQRLRVLSGMLFFLLIVAVLLPLHAGAERYVDNYDDTVSDTLTGLMWQQYDNGTTYTWDKALIYCEDLDLAEKTDWRLPNDNELSSIVDHTRSNPALDPVFSAHSDNYWSGTSYANYTDRAWLVDFSYGRTYAYWKSYAYYVRCVRGGPSVFGTLTLLKTGTGTGNVMSSPAGIDCGQSCSHGFAAGTKVTLTATPDSGSVFKGWSGGGCSGTGQCVITVNGNVTITAELVKSGYSISGTVKTGIGSPVPGVSMALTGASSGTASTNSGGLYSFSDLSNGVYTITPSKEQYTFSPSNRSVSINGGNMPKQDFTANPPGTHGPDLVITAVAGPSSGLVGQSVRVVETAKNQGDELAGACKIGLYLSKDTSFSTPPDIFLGTIDQWELEAGETAEASASVTIPTSVQAGSYYLIAVADMANKVQERNETNNARASAKRISVSYPKADLLVSEVSVPGLDTAKAGSIIEVYTRISNQGKLEAGPFTVELYISTDAVIKVSDTYLRDYDLTGLKAGQNMGTTSKVTIPKDLAPGKYYLGAIADTRNAVNESNEKNNGKASLKTILITK